ncbi:MBL fold metallo-hydrolase [Kribbella shirazensis]|jgi:glyoxylase-like metal-dependent hydrolase (beta-lactamase superfamily II)|uniref:Glyoxylase-like metal-dependent hydrolase (Beta-lactamase superfamily II) n=1 Tax=Kribbella shirazensis TaxID=1105143 RepID=A0A7X5ZXX4_9ACTN|nr:MBL fold metallo-hydrolase [Kribbella shirazensis]NIK54362.1 glyoxylase-like metal-dependent hydrolase (beta-lactamase superfamily II) [Kribbella shirazensis]
MIFQFSVGTLECVVVSDGQPGPPWEPPLDEFFTPASGVPADVLRDACGGRSTLTCGYNCLFVSTPDGTAVIDTGLGASFLGYGEYVEPLVGQLEGGMTSAGLSRSNLAAVVFTHLHQDHARGAIWSGELTFPAATAFAHASEVVFWSGSVELPSAQPHLEAARETIRLFGERLRPFEYDGELLPGVHAVAAPGHTPGHSAILLQSQGERLLCVGDTFYDPLQLTNPTWATPWDLDISASVATRRHLLERAADERILIHAYHLPFPGLGHVQRDGLTFAWHPIDG